MKSIQIIKNRRNTSFCHITHDSHLTFQTFLYFIGIKEFFQRKKGFIINQPNIFFVAYFSILIYFKE